MPGPSLLTVARLRGMAMRGEIEPQPGFTAGEYQAAGFPGDVAAAAAAPVAGIIPLGLNGTQAGMIPTGYNGYQIGPTHADVIPQQLGMVDGMPVSGPGVPEPPRQMVAKQWSVAVHSNIYGTFRIFYFRLLDGRIMMYNPSVKGWKIWRPYKNIVLGKRMKQS
ncbi:unnamed protein product, partial [marine sediment metagenome]